MNKLYKIHVIIKKNVHFSDLSPAPPIGFNLTYICPPGEVFDSDWLAKPFVLTTCQVCKKCGLVHCCTWDL